MWKQIKISDKFDGRKIVNKNITNIRRLFIIGASGHGKVIEALAREIACYSKITILDDNEELKRIGKVPGGKEYALEFRDCADVIVGIGNAAIRKKIIEYYEEKQINVTSLTHPFSWVASDVRIDNGTVIRRGAIVQPGCTLGKGVIVNTSSSIDHDCKIGNYCHISVGSHIAGTVCIGDNTWIGAGATVSNNITICNDVMIGAGAVVVKDIMEPGTYVGVPAKKIG